MVFPEETGLATAFIGSRGEAARAQEELLTAFAVLGLTYAPQALYFMLRYPEISPQRALFLALTDTTWRAFYETFSELASSHGAYIAACTNVAEVRRSTLPLEISLFGDPDHPEFEYVYMPVGPEVYNTAFIFDPSGEIIARGAKGQPLRLRWLGDRRSPLP